MNNISEYKKKFYTLIESELGDVKPILNEAPNNSSGEKMKIFLYKYCSLKSQLNREPSREEFTKTVQKPVMASIPAAGSYNVGYQVTDQDWQYLQSIDCNSLDIKNQYIQNKTTDIANEIVRAAKGSVFDPTWEEPLVTAVQKIDDAEEFDIINKNIYNQTRMNFAQLLNDELGQFDGKYVKMIVNHLISKGIRISCPSVQSNQGFRNDCTLK